MLAHVGTRQIETDRLILRKFKYSDSEDMLNYWVSDPEIQSMYSEPVYTTKQDVKMNCWIKYISVSMKNDNYYRMGYTIKGNR
ncbi:hypothetical protein DEAC_c39000 [Desulfosporosinus acididurans]|uniref:N-acetyltransferase domain-containing protein n=1 Tax=Desulfosporosinus acididurans TaxID=476652 RepID=A0A0J1FKS4_9FIRM|nr:hypothetical protein DEAC_c39000 [Desulfosporosinus acididurans]